MASGQAQGGDAKRGGDAVEGLSEGCSVARHVLSYLAAACLVAGVLTIVLHTMIPFERFGPLPLFSLAGLRTFLGLAGGMVGFGWIPFVPTTRYLLSRGRRGWLVFALAGIGYSVGATLAGLILLEGGGLTVQDNLLILGVFSACLSALFVPANLIYWALAIRPATLKAWQRICRQSEGRGG